MSDKTLEDDNLASTLINTSGCYTRFEEIYCITNKNISNDTMLDIFRVSYEKYSNKYTSALQKDDINNYNKGNGAYKHPIFSKNLTMVRFPSRDNRKLDIVRFFRYYPDKISEEIYSELKEECNILEKDNLTFNEALFILLGFNCVLAPDLDDYSINTSSHLIDKKLVRQSPGQDLKSFFANQEYKLTKTFLDWAENLNFITTLTDIKISNEEVAKLKQRPETIKKQRIITIEAKEILKNNPTLKREFLADDIEQRLIDKHKITNLTSTAIVRDYLKDYQKLKQEAKDYQKSKLKESKKP